MTLLVNLKNNIKLFFFELKRNPKAREAVRPLLLAVILFFSIIYAMNVLLISTVEKKLNALIAKKIQLEREVQDRDMIAAQVSQFEKQYTILKNKLKRLELKRKILLLERANATDDATFRRILLGLGPGSPQLRSFGLVKIVRETKSPASLVTLQGEMTYADLLEYLGYLQKRQEIGYLDRLNISEGFCADGRRQKKVHYTTDTICFQIVAGKQHKDTEEKE